MTRAEYWLGRIIKAAHEEPTAGGTRYIRIQHAIGSDLMMTDITARRLVKELQRILGHSDDDRPPLPTIGDGPQIDTDLLLRGVAALAEEVDAFRRMGRDPEAVVAHLEAAKSEIDRAREAAL